MNRSTLVAVAVFATLGVVTLATREKSVSVGVRKLSWAPIKGEQLTRIELGGAAPITLRAAEGRWTVASASSPDVTFEADPQQVQSLTDALASLKGGDFITDVAAKHGEYEVDLAKGLVIKAFAGDAVVRDLVLGKTAKNGGAYVRAASSDAVFSVPGSLGWLARKGLTDWRQKRITTLSADELVGVRAGDVRLKKDTTSWGPDMPLPAGFRFDAEAAARLATALTSLTAQDFSAGGTDAELGFDRPATITLESKAGRARTLTLGARQADGRRALRLDGEPQVFWLASWTAEQLDVSLEKLRDLRVMPFDVAQAKRLTVSHQGQRVVVEKRGEGWAWVEPKTAPAPELDLAMVPSVLQRLSVLRAAKPAAPGLSPGATAVTLELGLENGAVQRLTWAGGSGEVLVRAADGQLYVSNDLDRRPYEQGPALFKKPPRPPPGAMQGLEQLPPELRAQLEAQLRQPPPGP